MLPGRKDNDTAQSKSTHVQSQHCRATREMWYTPGRPRSARTATLRYCVTWVNRNEMEYSRTQGGQMPSSTNAEFCPRT